MSGMGKISGASKNSLLSSSSSLRSPLAGQHRSGKGDRAGQEGTSSPVSCSRLPCHHQQVEGVTPHPSSEGCQRIRSPFGPCCGCQNPLATQVRWDRHIPWDQQSQALKILGSIWETLWHSTCPSPPLPEPPEPDVLAGSTVAPRKALSRWLCCLASCSSVSSSRIR